MTIRARLLATLKKINPSYFFGIIVIAGSAFLIMGVMITRKAIDPEALANLRFMRVLTLVDIWRGGSFPGLFVTYRPVMATLTRLEYLIFGVNPPAFFTTNLILLIVVACLIYEIIYRKTKAMLPALVAALFFLTDWRLTPNIYVIGEVQITLAAIFGLAALWLIWFGRRQHTITLIGVFLLLLLAVLSKEFGLAFALAVFIDAIINQKPGWKKYAGIAVGVVVAFVGIRLLLGIIPSSAKEYASFLNMLKWYFVNIGSGFFYTFVNLYRPGSDGELPGSDNLRYAPAEAWQILILQIIPVIIVFLLGFRDKNERRFTVPLLFAIVGNSILFFWTYAFRFHFLGNVSMYIIAGFGLSYIVQKWRGQPQRWNAIILIFMFATLLIAWRGEAFHAHLSQLATNTDSSRCDDNINFSEPEIERCVREKSLCIPTEAYYAQENYRGFYTVTDPETVRQVMEFYDMPLENCTCLDPNPTCLAP